MAERTDPVESDPSIARDDSSHLVLDDLDEKLAAFQAFRKNDEEAADAILTQLGANDELDRTIILELGASFPLVTPTSSPRPTRS